MFLAFFIYEVFVVALSGFLAWHFPVSDTIQWLIGGVCFIAFNGLFFLMHITHKTFTLSRELTVLFSFLLAVVSYLVLTFIIHDLLLIIPPYGTLYFSYPHHFIIGLSLLVTFIAFYAVWNTQNIKVKKYTLLSDKNVSVRLAFLSDLHIAPNNMSVAKLRDIFDRLNTLKPDFVILGGDVIEMRPDYFMERVIIELFQNFNTQNTVIGVVGNHEYYGGVIADNIKAMESGGIIILKDDVRVIPDKNITFIGRDDKINMHRLPLNILMQQAPASSYRVVIDHDPSSIMDSITQSADLHLSGHTHNGQLFPFNLLVKYMFLNGYGYRKINHTDTIVSSGIGTWGPTIRIGTHNEIVLIDVNPK